MRKILLLALVFVTSFTALGQDFSNKGKDFWLCFPQHVQNSAANLATLSIFITSDQASSGTITMPNSAFSGTFSIAANGIQEILIPWNNSIHILNTESTNETITQILKKAIRVKVNPGQPAVVAYAQQWAGARSAATLLLPTSVLGKKYYAMSFAQNGTNGPMGSGILARSQFQIIATQDNTNVEITPVKNGVKGVKFTVNLPLAGDMIQYQSGDAAALAATQDLTGTLIESVASGSGGCQPIAVFSGSSNTTFGTASPFCNGGSYDPLWQQAYPASTWGKSFGLIPFADYLLRGNPYRVMAAEDNTNVYFDGTLVATLNAGQIYPAAFTSNPVTLLNPTNITADKPICVGQYAQADVCTGQTGGGRVGDPDMVILNPIEQNISDITVFASIRQSISRQYINVLIKTTGTGNFKINGAAPLTAWQPFPSMPGYSYLRHLLSNPASQTSYRLTADSGFNAIAYGWGNVESYAYSAGTNVIDLSKELELETTYGIETSPSICTNAPFKFKFYIPDSTLGTPPVAIRFDSLRWDLSNPSLISPNNFPIMVYPPCGPPCTVTYDSITIKNGKRVTWYSLPTTYYFTAAGNDTLLVTGYTSTNEGCGANKLYDFAIVISDPPTANFDTIPPSCYLLPVVVNETTPQFPKTTYRHWWEFFDPVTNVTTVITNAPPNPPGPIRTWSHTFTTPGVKRIRHASITTPGCLSDTIVRFVTIPDLPNATISGNPTPVCINAPVGPDVVFTGSLGTPEYIFTYRINGGTPIVSAPSVGGVLTIQHPTGVANTFIYELLSVQNVGSGTCTRNIAGQTVTVTITPDATVTLTSAPPTNNQTVCVNNNITNITYSIAGSGNGGTVSGLPPGVTGTYSGGVITILGAPTTAIGSPFTYTINPTGPCAVPAPPVTGTITVNDDATITLTSAAGTNNQTICINTSITDIDYLVARGGTGATIAWTPGVPPGINFIPLGGGGFRITGILGATGAFNYTITTTGPCINPIATGSITGNPDHTIAFNGGTPNPTLCVNTVMPAFTLLIGGGATGITSAGLPPGVTATLGAGGMVTISGTPSSAIGSPFIYTITTTGNACITASYTNTITVTDNATLTLLSGSTTQAVCRNTPIADIDYITGASATGATISWVPSAPTGINFTPVGVNGFKISGTPTVVGTQTYTYTIQTTGPCVNPTATGSITVNALPVASFTITPPGCANNTVVFTNTSVPNAAGATWAWDFGDPNANGSNPNTSTALNPTHYYIIPNTAPGYTVTLTATNSNGCISNPIASMFVVINDTPQAGFIVPEVCINDVATQFIDTSKITSGTIIRSQNQWNYGDPGSGPANTSIGQDGLHLYTATGIYQVTQIVTSNTGCKDTIVLPITINSADPVSNFSINNSGGLCSRDSVELVNLSTVGFGSVTRLDIYWDNVGAPGIFETINVPVFNGITRHKYPTSAINRNYVIRMVAYSGAICFAQRITPITVYANPVVQFNNIPNTCYLVAPFQLTQGSEIGGVPGTGTYSGPGITNPNGTFNPQVAGVGTHNIKYTWTASNPGACIDTLTRTITVLDTAHAKFSVAMPSCEQLPTSFTNLSTAPASVTLASTVWDFGDATGPQTFAIAAPVNHTYLNPGNYTVTMHTVSTTPPTPGCLSTDTSAVITIDANHHITWDAASGSQNQPLCVNTSIVPIRYTLSGGATNVNFIPALPPGLTYTVGGTPLTLTISGAPTVPASYTFDIETAGNTCVKDGSTVTISVAPDHAIALRAGSDTAQSLCLNTPISDIYYDLSGGSTGVNISGLPTGVTYTVTGNELRIYGTPTSIPGTPDYTINTTGNACLSATKIGKIFVHPYAVPSFTVDKPNYCIPNAIVVFTNTTTPAPVTNNTYLWNFGDGSPEVPFLHPTHWYTSGIGPFTVRLTATTIPSPILTNGQPGCSSFTDVPMTSIHPQPKADFVFSKPSVCIGDNVLITDNTDGRDGIVNQWNWDMGDGVKRFTNPVTYTYSDTITYTITMYSINTHGCNSDTIKKPFTVYPYPHVSAGPDKFVLEGGSVELESTSFANDPKYTWTPDLYLTDAKVARPRVMNPKTDMTYLFTVTGRGGCATGDNVFVKLLKFPAIPNTFSPNNDGINDKWRIDYLNTYPNNRVQIFTRSGNLVFESRGYNTPWDGTLKGKPLPFDTYYYIIEPGNGRDPITGYVTILK